jgi:hypothetical protein
MSRKPQAMGNLEAAKKVRQSGAPTKIHGDPEVKQFIDYYVKQGGKSLREIHRMTLEKFGKERAPSQPGLASYVRKYFKAENGVIAPPTVLKAIEDFNALAELVKDIEKMGELCETFFERQKTMGIPMENVRKYYDSRREGIAKYIQLGIQLGVLSGNPEPPSTVIGNMTVNQTKVDGSVVTVEVPADMPLLDQLIEIERQEKAYADSHTEETARTESTEATVQQ